MTDDVVHCRHGETCGACSFLGLAYPAQMRRKERLLATALRTFRSLSRAELLPCMESPEIAGYRNRAKMAVAISRHDLDSLGYFRPRSREVEDAPDCVVLKPELLETTRAFRNWLRGPKRVPKVLRHIDVRCGSDAKKQHLTLVLRTDEMPNFPLDGIRKACRHVDGISINLNPSAGPQVIKGPIHHQWGSRDLFVDLAGMSLRLSAGSFFQVNPSVLPAIHEVMADFLSGGRRLADLYSGVGTHGFALCRDFESVLAVEGARSSVADAKATIRRFKLQNVKVVSKPVERSLEPLRDHDADCVIMNPSRAGAVPSVLDTLGASAAKRIVYLSCNPQTLARDLDHLVRAGFRLESVQPIDMMPQTRQVEAIALLRR